VTTTNDSQTAGILEAIRTRLEAAHVVLVVSHVDPDGDAVGTQLAFGAYLRSLGKEVLLARDSEIPDKYRFLPGIDAIIPVSEIDADASIDTMLVLECPSQERLGSANAFLERAATVINIDHHPDNVLPAAVSWVDTTASSVGEMTFEYLRSVEYQIDPDIATHLYTAILTDTGRFRFESTTARTLAVTGELVRAGANPRSISDQVYYNQDPALMRLTGLVVSNIEYHADGQICLLLLTREILKECGVKPADTEGLVDYSLYARGVKIGALMRDIDDQTTKISLRSRNGCDVSKVASSLGGGGHPNAAGCRIKLPLDAAKPELVKMLQEACGPKD
jgi:phosphoesterase RecJ-like protein